MFISQELMDELLAKYGTYDHPLGLSDNEGTLLAHYYTVDGLACTEPSEGNTVRYLKMEIEVSSNHPKYVVCQDISTIFQFVGDEVAIAATTQLEKAMDVLRQLAA